MLSMLSAPGRVRRLDRSLSDFFIIFTALGFDEQDNIATGKQGWTICPSLICMLPLLLNALF
jgi:hypothetical protein